MAILISNFLQINLPKKFLVEFLIPANNLPREYYNSSKSKWGFESSSLLRKENDDSLIILL